MGLCREKNAMMTEAAHELPTDALWVQVMCRKPTQVLVNTCYFIHHVLASRLRKSKMI